MFLAAVIQLSSTSDQHANLAAAESLVRRAAGYGAQLVATPESTNFLGPHAQKVRMAEPLDGSTSTRFARLAKSLGIYLLVGSFNERSDEPNRCYNTSVLYDPQGTLLAAYRKIHLFDVDYDNVARFIESKTCKPGDSPVVVATQLGVIGLSICYDLRFPRLYQELVNQGAEIIMVPSAFVVATGKDHWHPLVRARAIETQCYVLAPGQEGKHDDQGLRHSYGHSMIVDPWGHTLGMVGDGVGVALAEVDLAQVRRIRKAMPVREHRRF